ncbi:MAG: transcription-repair coupling factor [Elusimicrobia bacterium]|nr:transcription-repair coupling factor [Elusimicrobiota bacterium]
MAENVGLAGVSGAGAWAHLALSLLSGAEDEVLRRLSPQTPGRLIVVRKAEEELEDVEDALASLKALFPQLEKLPPPAFFGDDAQRRQGSLERLHRGATVVLATPEGLAAAAPAKDVFQKDRLSLTMGGTIPLSMVIDRLARLGYQRVDFVESPGEFAVRGAVVDVYALEPLRAVRILFNENLIESVRHVDTESQASGDFIHDLAITPAAVAPEAKPSTVLDWLGEEALFLIEEGIPAKDFGARRTVAIGAFAESPLDYGAAPSMRFQGNLKLASKQFEDWRAQGLTVVLFAINQGEEERVEELLRREETENAACEFLVGPLGTGFVLPRRKLAVVTTSEIFERSYRPAKAWGKFDQISQKAFKPADLKPGDYVVHQDYGIARYRGIRPVETGERAEGGDPSQSDYGRSEGMLDCLTLEYRNNDRVYTPMYDFRLVQRFVGAEGHRPRLSSLDTRSWEEVKERVKEGVRDMAEELLKMEAARAAQPGHAFSIDSRMEEEFAEAFPYEETPDQRRAIEEVKADMMAGTPMDRVVVGDVGFGKTEVAMRAALKCVADGLQVSVLVPTTILADQHFRTFSRRFAEYPVKLALLSRFTPAKEEKAALALMAKGEVDIAIGTHRLLSPDIKFKNLGLVIVDEEHRFGVKDKERLKTLRKDVDILTLSATPIPRTLNQALTGLRRVSLIQSAPSGRQPIVTKVGPWSEEAVVQAIQAELDRGGQAYYVFNKVRALPEKISELGSLMPGVKFCMAHGQLRADALEKAMWEFFQRKYDVLVASTIIESGLDIPTVNTLIVENAQDFGLAQLYQLRGRIGRERQKAFCYLFYPPGIKDVSDMPEEARHRLTALREFAALGSGMKLAMRDLEIRGAGDLLGAKQHGFINAVGVEYYSELLQSEIARLKGKPKAKEVPPVQLDAPIQAYLPEDYLPGELERLSFYKRLLAAKPSELPGMRQELEDLSGPLPAAAKNLFRLMETRHAAGNAGLREATFHGTNVEMRFRSDAVVPPEAMAAWNKEYDRRLEFVHDRDGDGLRIRLAEEPQDPLEWLERFLRLLVKP